MKRFNFCLLFGVILCILVCLLPITSAQDGEYEQQQSESPVSSSPTTPTTLSPTKKPTTEAPTKKNTTKKPTPDPTNRPSRSPVHAPTRSPTLSKPTRSPITPRPSRSPVTSRPTRSPVTPRPSRSPVTPRPSKSPVTSRPTKSPVPKPTRSPTKSPVITPSPTKRTTSPSINLVDVQIVSATMTDKMVLTVVFSSPIYFNDNTKVSKKMPCPLVLSQPLLPEEIDCRVSGDGLTLTSTSLSRLASPPEYYEVVTIANMIYSTNAGKVPLPSLSAEIELSTTLEPVPVVELQASSCGNLYFSWAKSTGNANKPFYNREWIVFSTFTDLNREIQQLLYDSETSSTQTVLSRYALDSRFHGKAFTMQLALTNQLYFTGRSNPFVIRIESAVPKIENGNATSSIVSVTLPVEPATVAPGAPQFSLIAPKEEVSIQSDFFLQVIPTFPLERCVDGSSAFPNGTRYPVWRYGEEFPRGFRGTQLRGDESKLIVFAGQLGVGNYTFEAEVSRYQTLYASVQITMDAFPSLMGGNRSINVEASATLRLDSSYGNGSIADLRWSCRSYALTLGAADDESQPEAISDELADPNFFFNRDSTNCPGAVNGILSRARSSPIVEIPAANLQLSQVYLFSADLTVYTRGPVYKTIPAYLVRTGALGGFSIEIDPATQPIVGKGKVNTQLATLIRAQSKERNLRYEWRMTEGDLDDTVLDSIDFTKSLIRFPPSTLTPGQRYEFRVNVVNAKNLFATISFIGNEPPDGGFVSVTPTTGYSGETDFTFKADFFTDEDLPISYSFLVARRDCFKVSCFNSNGRTSVFNPLTPFFPDTTATTKIEFYSQPQTIGCIAQDALGAVSPVVMANTTILVQKPSKNAAELVDSLRQASANPEDGSKVWTDILAALSNIEGTATSGQLLGTDLTQALQTAQQAAEFAPKKMSSLVIENKISARITSEFGNVIQSDPVVFESTVKSMGSVLDRAKTVLSLDASGSVIGEGDVELLRSLTSDTLDSSSALLDKAAESEVLDQAPVSIPKDIVAKLVQVQMSIPIKAQSADSERFFKSKNIDSSFIAKFYEDVSGNASTNPQEPGTQPPTLADQNPFVIVVSPSETEPNSFTLPSDAILAQLDKSNNSLAFASSVFYRVNPFSRATRATNQTVLGHGVTSLEIYDASNGEKIESFSTPMDFRLKGALDRRSFTSDITRQTFELNRTVVDKANKRNVTVTERIFCGYFDYDQDKWSSYGCSIKTISKDGLISCSCNHTTDYTAWVETVHEIVLTFTDVSNFDNISDGAAVLAVLLTWVVVTCLFLVWGAWLDDRDTKRRVRQILFSLKMRRLRDMRIKHRVFRAWRLEAMKQSGVLMDASGPMPPALSSIISLNRRNKLATTPPKPPPEMQVDLSTTPKRLWHFFSVSFYREHTLLNTIFLLDAFLTRPMRVLCGAAVVLGEMFAGAIFYNFDIDNEVTIGMKIAVALLSVLVVSPVVALFVLMTRRVSAMPGAQRRYLQQMMVVLIAEMGEDRKGDDVQRWAGFAKQVTWNDLEQIHRYQALKEQMEKLKRQSSTPQNKEAIKALQQEIGVQRQIMMSAWRNDGKQFDAKAARALSRQDATSKVEGEEFDTYGLPVSGNTHRWLTTVSSNSKLTSPLNQKKAKPKLVTRKTNESESARYAYAFTPRPFHVETPRFGKASKRRVEDDDDDEEEDSLRIKVRDFFKNLICKPIFFICRARPASWNRSSLTPPEDDVRFSHNWIYFCYFLLAAYYALGFFYTLSWGFRAKNEAVANWLPTVALSVLFDMLVIQPIFIFVRFALMNEVLYRMEGGDVSVIGMSWRSKRSFATRRFLTRELDNDEDDDPIGLGTKQSTNQEVPIDQEAGLGPGDDIPRPERLQGETKTSGRSAPVPPPSVSRARAPSTTTTNTVKFAPNPPQVDGVTNGEDDQQNAISLV